MNKIKIILLTTLAAFGFAACKDSPAGNSSSSDKATNNNSTLVSGAYIDLNTGETVKLRKDKETGYVLNDATGEPLDLYVNTATRDTFYGRTGTVVNRAVVYKEGKYELDESKIKWEGKELKVKNAHDDGKVKIERHEVKHKFAGGGKIKRERHEKKIKMYGFKIKREKHGIKVKPD
jgi:hypothetical protein